MNNVFINHYRHGKLVDHRELHNVWVDNGRKYLAEMITETVFGSPVREDRLKYFGVGIGSTRRNVLATQAPLSTSYPAGNDPWATAGNEYQKEYAPSPDVQTLELPVRKSGGELAYDDPLLSATDVWLFEPPDVYFTHQTTQSVTAHCFIDASTYVTYGSFTQVPLTEAGLYTDGVHNAGGAAPADVAVDVNKPYSPLVAYVNFDTILLDSNSTVEFIWSVRFAP